MKDGLLDPQKHNQLLAEARKIEEYHHYVPEYPSRDGYVLAGSIIIGMVLAAQTAMMAPSMQEQVDTTAGWEASEEVDAGKIITPMENTAISHQARKRLASMINHHWKTGYIRANQIVGMAIDAGELSDLDPLLILSVMAKESSFQPDAANQLGPEGLMQVWRKWHTEKYKDLGIPDYKKPTPRENVILGAAILREYINMERHDLKRALQRYNGALASPDTAYADGVLEVHSMLSNVSGRMNEQQFNATHVAGRF